MDMNVNTNMDMNKVPSFCIGSTRVNFGKWYVPNGKLGSEFTYCEYCLINGCTTKDEVYLVTAKINNCNCDCVNRDKHPRFKPLTCPVCMFERGDCRMATCGYCSECLNSTPYLQSYCPGCSWQLKACLECGKEITDGNFYLTAMTDKIQQCIIEKDDTSEYLIKRYNQRFEEVSGIYSDKSKEEMIQLLSIKK